MATPYDVYMKTLYTLVRDRLEDVAPKDLIVDNEISKQLADFQKVAVTTSAFPCAFRRRGVARQARNSKYP